MVTVFFLVTAMALDSQLFGAESDFIEKFRNLALKTVELRDLCTGKIERVPKNVKVDLWSFRCGNCRQKIEDTGSHSLLVNVDEFKEERVKACNWVKSKRLRSLSDTISRVKFQMGGDFPIPAELWGDSLAGDTQAFVTREF